MHRLLGALWDLVPGKRPMLEVLRSVAVPPERIYKHLHFEGVFSVVGNGSPIKLRSHGNVIENEVFWRGLLGGWEARSLQLWEQLAAHSTVILDVGSNSGIYALAARAISPAATVLAFEPVARVFEKLTDNVGLNGGTVTCVNMAVSDVTGAVLLFEPPDDHPLSATVEPEVFAETGRDRWQGIEVPSTRLDDYLGASGLVPSLIKIDVEGHEAAVLRGLGEMLVEHRPTLLVEALTDAHLADLKRHVAGLDYVAFYIDETSGPQGLQSIRPSGVGHNVLFCRPEVAEVLMLRA